MTATAELPIKSEPNRRGGCLWRGIKVILITLLIFIVIIAALLAWGWNRLTSLPEWWSPADAKSPAVVTQAAQFENWVVKETHTVRPLSQRDFILQLNESDVNAWLAARLGPWARNRNPADVLGRQDILSEINVNMEQGALWIGAHLVGAEKGPFQKRIGVALTPQIDEEGNLTVRIADACVGNFHVGAGAADRLVSWLPTLGDARLEGLLRGKGRGIPTRVRMGNGVVIEMTRIEVVPGAVRIHFSIPQ